MQQSPSYANFYFLILYILRISFVIGTPYSLLIQNFSNIVNAKQKMHSISCIPASKLLKDLPISDQVSFQVILHQSKQQKMNGWHNRFKSHYGKKKSLGPSCADMINRLLVMLEFFCRGPKTLTLVILNQFCQRFRKNACFLSQWPYNSCIQSALLLLVSLRRIKRIPQIHLTRMDSS